jgi:hypothetical protein
VISSKLAHLALCVAAAAYVLLVPVRAQAEEVGPASPSNGIVVGTDHRVPALAIVLGFGTTAHSGCGASECPIDEQPASTQQVCITPKLAAALKAARKIRDEALTRPRPGRIQS